MHIELTGPAQRLVEKLLAQGRFRTADEAVEYALEFFKDCQPTMESLNSKLREAHQAHEAGQSVPLDVAAIKEELGRRIGDRPDGC